MAIIFHCDYCGKKIEAGDNAGGKWGKCPKCHNKVYVPDLNIADGEELKLSPVDEKEILRKKQLMMETFQVEQDILSQKAIPQEESSSAEDTSNPDDIYLPKTAENDMTTNIIVCLRQMADGELENAEATMQLILPFGDKAVAVLDKIALNEMPEPELADIPPQVLSGMIRNLRTQLS
ncbi:MAG: hypothetical protein E4H40_07830 [Candidatus Brocadiia bacterium]|nr:MAG: hypothetical protein E4H40_07830 [Candidatus Brocadiia bacterium]